MKRGRPPKLTCDELRELVSTHPQADRRELAALAGLSYNGCCLALRRVGVQVPRKNLPLRRNVARIEQVRTLTAAGWAITEIAALLGVSRQRVQQIQSAYGIARPQRPLSVAQAAQRLGVSCGGLLAAARRLGLPLCRQEGRRQMDLDAGDLKLLRDELRRPRRCEGCGAALRKPRRRWCSKRCRSRANYVQQTTGGSGRETARMARTRAAVERVRCRGAVVGLTEAVRLSGLSLMQVEYLSRVGVLATRLSDTVVWQGRQPQRLYYTAELRAAGRTYR